MNQDTQTANRDGEQLARLERAAMNATESISYEIERRTLDGGEGWGVVKFGLDNLATSKRLIASVRRSCSGVFAYRLLEVDPSRECRRRVIG